MYLVKKLCRRQIDWQ